MKNINKILKEVLVKVNPSREELNSIDKFLKGFIFELEKKLKELKVDAEVFVGGSFAKKTMIKKGQYDIDIFVRFGDRYKKEDISKLTEKALKKIKKKIILIHGSRDYFKINIDSSFFVEIIPVMKVKNQKQAENITDLSYFHVNYIKKKLRTEKILEDVRLAKAFCYANKCYGAESYINGFSGYALELLVYYYRGFLNFVKAITKIKDKELIDIERLYKNECEIRMNMNSAKMSSPIVLIDPTYKERNALAALSDETFEQFKIVCRNFLKNPGVSYFEIKKIDFDKMKKESKKKGYEFLVIKAITKKQEGDIAGSKLLKFFRHLGIEMEKYFEIKKRGFEYDDRQSAEYFFAAKRRKELILPGPETKDSKKNILRFKNRHKIIFVKGKRIYAREKVNFDLKEFFGSWTKKNKERVKEMAIEKVEIVQ